MTIAYHPAARAERAFKHAAILHQLGLTRSGYEVFGALIQELGNGVAPDWLDRFAVEEFGGTWDEVSTAFADMCRVRRDDDGK